MPSRMDDGRRELEPRAEPLPPPDRGPKETQAPYYKGVVPFAVLAAAVVVLMGLRLVGVVPGLESSSADDISAKSREARLEAFLSAAPVILQLVSPIERERALMSMKLDESAQAALGTHAPLERSNDPAAVRLAWITLWDTDDEDGDVVRIDSEGYTRTVSLTKQPVTFAVPVPADGVINVTGVRDGEGGGITVGAASGGAQVILPIMSVGQIIGLHVRGR